MVPRPTPHDRTCFQTVALLICVTGLTILCFQVLRSAGGLFVFTLDDPYIHLSLAENLLRGHYGVNLGEVASPSSSIIYPVLVAITLAVGFGDFGPMILNIIGALGTAWLLAGFLWDGLAKNQRGGVPVIAYLVLPFLLLAVNGYALAFTGMEHTLHVFVSLAILRGLLQVSRDSGPTIWLILALIAAPLLRFEGFALSGAALLAVAFWGHWTRAITTGVVILAITGCYMTLMISLGLPVLPSSVMVKLGTTTGVLTPPDQTLIDDIFGPIRGSLADRQGRIVAAGVILLLIGAALNRSSPQARVVAGVAAAAAIAHLIIGRWGWFSRYEIYVVATTIAGLLIVWAPRLSTAARRFTTPGLMIFVFPFIGYIYLVDTILTPKAAQNVYEQQYQMHRFAVDYFPEPVAVTDLGWVTYRNDSYVLDLWGLGSETARTLFADEGRTPKSVSQLTSTANVSYAMIYEETFYEGLPADWCYIAQLETIQQTSAFATVEFFLIDPAKQADMRAALIAFSESLPATTSFKILSCD